MTFSAVLFATPTWKSLQCPSSRALLTADSSPPLSQWRGAQGVGWAWEQPAPVGRSLSSLAVLRIFCAWCRVMLKRRTFIRCICSEILCRRERTAPSWPEPWMDGSHSHPPPGDHMTQSSAGAVRTLVCADISIAFFSEKEPEEHGERDAGFAKTQTHLQNCISQCTVCV